MAADAERRLLEARVLGACSLRDYELVRVAGVGRRGMCLVARCARGAAAARAPERLYALKLTFDASDGDLPALLALERADVDVASRLPAHPAIAGYLAQFIDAPGAALLRGGAPPEFAAAAASPGRLAQFTVFEHVEGTTLQAYLAANGPPGPAVLVRLARDMLGALAFLAPLGVCHRDVEPDNIMVAAGGPEPRFVLIDFGLAVSVDPATMADPAFTDGGLPGGSNRHFHAPEVLNVALRAERAARTGRGGGGVHVMPYGRQDVFALGCVLYEAASGGLHPLGPEYPGGFVNGGGDVAYEDSAIGALPREFGERFAAVVRSMLACDPRARASAAGALAML